MIRRVRLGKQPGNLRIPESLSARFGYDSEKRELFFSGGMSKVDFDELMALSRDIEYQRAVENLFRVCTFDSDEPEQKRSGWAKIVAFFGVLGVVAAVLMRLR